MAHLDGYSRPINYLRVSVTDRCNLRCQYCMPPEGIPWIPHDTVLRYEEIALIVRAAAELGINRIRLTGGEPLVRLGMADLVRMLRAVPGVEDLAMTTNGILLPRYARDLAEAGLDRVNISLDTLRPERFQAITRGGRLEDVLAGIKAAHQAGLEPVKINTVVMRGTNDDEVVDLAWRTMEAGWNVRFIEWMPVGTTASADDSAWRGMVVTADEMRQRIEIALGDLQPAMTATGSGPARYYRLPGAKGTIGFITPVSEHFCYHCNRLRLTADGQLRPCLLSDREIDLRTPLRQGADVPQIKELILQAIDSKPLQHHLNQCGHGRPENRVMSQIGG
jgi:cyclic pyranopterin phosphate synthase